VTIVAADYCHDILAAEGFRRIGTLDCDLHVELWWHPQHRLEVSVVTVGEWVLIRGAKYYRLKAMGEQGELYTRDLAAFDADLTTRFGEVHLLLSAFPDITADLARRRIAEKRFRPAGGGDETGAEDLPGHLNQLAAELEALQVAKKRDEDLLRLDRGRSPTLARGLGERIAKAQGRIKEIQAERKGLADRLAATAHLEKEYLQKAAATCLLFASCSNVQVAGCADEFTDVLRAVVKELQDVHQYQIQQKFQGGKLQIYIEEVEAPGVSLLTRWAGGVLCPRQLERLGPQFQSLRGAVERQLMVFPHRDILLGGAVQDERKLVSARVVRNFLHRLERVPSAARSGECVSSPPSAMPMWIGHVMNSAGEQTQPWEFPLDRAVHTLISGRTGSGKSYLGRVIVEGAAACEDVSIVVLDPRGQWTGLLAQEDRAEILGRYGEFGLDPSQARSFDFAYYGIGQGLGRPLPADLRRLAEGRHIVGFKGLDDRARCEWTARVLEALFDACAIGESLRLRLSIAIDEAIQFIRRGVVDEAKDAAAKVELALERIAREGRKYGIGLLAISQSSRDFSYSLASVRENVATHVFMANGSAESEYAARYLGAGHELSSLRTGEAIVQNGEWGVVRVAVRPPLSKVWEPTEAEVRSLVGGQGMTSLPLSPTARAILDAAMKNHRATGRPVRLASVVEQLGITSRRRVDQVVAELEAVGVARFERLNERGRPLVMTPMAGGAARGNRT
jgi:hypothetical protein